VHEYPVGGSFDSVTGAARHPYHLRRLDGSRWAERFACRALSTRSPCDCLPICDATALPAFDYPLAAYFLFCTLYGVVVDIS